MTAAITTVFEIDVGGFENNILVLFVQIFCTIYMFAHAVATTQFLLTVIGIRFRYKKINLILESKLISKMKRNKILSPNVNESSKMLRTLSNLHLKLFETISLTNRIYSFPVMVAFGFYISSGVFSLYELFSVFSDPNVTKQQIGFCLIINAWLPNAVLYTIVEIACCMAAADEGKGTTKILRSILCKEKDEKIRIKLRTFLLQLSHSTPVIGCGLFEFHWECLGIVG